MITEFRIREHRFTDGLIWFMPEMTIERKPFPEGGPDWINVGGAGQAFFCDTYENAFGKIKEYFAQKNISMEFDIIHNLPEITMVYNK
jgi:hypothetical protein